MGRNSEMKEKILSAIDFQSFYEKDNRKLEKANKREWAKGICPFHDDHDPSCSFNLNDGRFSCFACGAKGSIFDYYMKRYRVDFQKALSDLSEFTGIQKPERPKRWRRNRGEIIVIYDYQNLQGKLVFQVCRLEPKRFRQRRPDPEKKGRFIWNLDGVTLVPYRLPELMNSKQVLIVEGEKDVDTLMKLGFVATCNPMGAGKWRIEFSEYFKGKQVFILPDNDKPGHDHATQVAEALFGIAESLKIVNLPGLSDKEDVSDWLNAGHTKEELMDLVQKNHFWKPESPALIFEKEVSESTEQDDSDPWNIAKELFPRAPFPWGVFPQGISESLKQLARSCATSPIALPGAAIAIFSSIVGSTVNVSPKKSWREPLIFWFADIRPSGAGKTPAARALCRVLYKAQYKADKIYKEKMAVWHSKAKKNRGPEPERPRGFFITELTLEGLRGDITGHGGTVCIMDELSSFLSAQNQYKNGRGNDREAWLCIHDGKPARIIRAGGAITISGARVNLFGGVQPRVWQMIFGGNKGIFVDDGTVYRFLPTYENDRLFELTAETWSDTNIIEWERTLQGAMNWADEFVSNDNWSARNLLLDQDAQDLFFNWRNELHETKFHLPEKLRGFLPKITSYAARLSGLLYLMNNFAGGKLPNTFLSKSDVEKGIKTAMFYMGNVVYATEALCTDRQITPIEVTELVRHLAKTLEDLKNDLDSGRLAIGFITENYNATSRTVQKISSRAMGILLREQGLTIPARRFRANGKSGAYCLLWDQKTDAFLDHVRNVHQVHKTVTAKTLSAMDMGEQYVPSPSHRDKEENVVEFKNETFNSLKPCLQKVCEHDELCELDTYQQEQWETGTI